MTYYHTKVAMFPLFVCSVFFFLRHFSSDVYFLQKLKIHSIEGKQSFYFKFAIENKASTEWSKKKKKIKNLICVSYSVKKSFDVHMVRLSDSYLELYH